VDAGNQNIRVFVTRCLLFKAETPNEIDEIMTKDRDFEKVAKYLDIEAVIIE